MIAQAPPKSAEVFAAFRPIDLAEALTQRDLTPSASDLFLYLHTIAPFGNFYSWNDTVNQRSIREALKRRTGKHRGKPMDIRTYQRSRKQLVSAGLVAVSKRGFRILELACRRTRQQDEPQLNVFSWAKMRQLDRDRPPEPLPESSSSDRKDPDLDLSRSKTLVKQKHPPTHLFVPKAKAQKEFGTRDDSSRLNNTNPTQTTPQKRLRNARSSKRRTYAPPPAFTKLNEKYLPELEAVGIPKERVYRSLVDEINLHSWEEFCTAIAYTKQRQSRAELPPIESPAAYLMDAMQKSYQPQALQPNNSAAIPIDQEWLDLAYNKLHLCYSMRRPDGEMAIIFMDAAGEPQPPVALAIAQQQYSLEQLRSMVESQQSAVSGQELGAKGAFNAQELKEPAPQQSVNQSPLPPDTLFPLSSPSLPPQPQEWVEQDDFVHPSSEAARLAPDEIRAFIETLAPGDPDDYERDFALKLDWFRDRLQHFGCDDPFLEEWKPFQIGDVQLVELSVGWTLEVIPF